MARAKLRGYVGETREDLGATLDEIEHRLRPDVMAKNDAKTNSETATPDETAMASSISDASPTFASRTNPPAAGSTTQQIARIPTGRSSRRSDASNDGITWGAAAVESADSSGRVEVVMAVSPDWLSVRPGR